MRRHEPATAPDVYTSDAIARLFGVDESTAQRWIRSGELGPRVRVGKKWCILRASMLRTLSDREVLP